MRAGGCKPPAIIEDRRRATGPLMIARADGEPLHAIFEEAIRASASGVKVTVKKVEPVKDGRLRV